MVELDKPLDSPDIPDANYGAMPIGDYKGFIEEATEEKSQNDNEMIHLVVRLEGNEAYDNRVLHYYLVFGLEHSLEAAKRLMVALGQDITGMKSIKAESLVGLRCKIHTKHEEYNGEIRDRIHYFVPVNMGEVMAGSNFPGSGDDVPF